VELRQLRAFVAVAEARHFGQAAQRLPMAQSALSQVIRKLEAELGVSLFTRTTRSVELTSAGRFLHTEAVRILTDVADATRGVRRLAAGRHGLLRLGLTGTVALSHLPEIVRTLRRELPDVALQIQTDLLTPDQCDQLRAGSLDLGVLRPPAAGGEIDVLALADEPLVLAVPLDHPLASQPAIAMDDLEDTSFIMYGNHASAVNAAVTRSCREAGFLPRSEHVAPGTAALLALVSAGLGVSLVPAGARRLSLENVTFREVPGSGTVRTALAWRSGNDDPVLSAVLDILRACPPMGSPDRSQTPTAERIR
jgi:DNA-binding transcriptional LysR family regulator